MRTDLKKRRRQAVDNMAVVGVRSLMNQRPPFGNYPYSLRLSVEFSGGWAFGLAECSMVGGRTPIRVWRKYVADALLAPARTSKLLRLDLAEPYSYPVAKGADRVRRKVQMVVDKRLAKEYYATSDRLLLAAPNETGVYFFLPGEYDRAQIRSIGGMPSSLILREIVAKQPKRLMFIVHYANNSERSDMLDSFHGVGDHYRLVGGNGPYSVDSPIASFDIIAGNDEKMSLARAMTIAEDRKRSRGAEKGVAVFGFSLPANTVGLAAPLLIAGASLYLLLHLGHLRAAKRAGLEIIPFYPWFPLYEGTLPAVATVVSFFLPGITLVVMAVQLPSLVAEIACYAGAAVCVIVIPLLRESLKSIRSRTI